MSKFKEFERDLKTKQFSTLKLQGYAGGDDSDCELQEGMQDVLDRIE